MSQFRRLDDQPCMSANRPREVCVVVPPEHQGVANALRLAYPAERTGVPADLIGLIDRIG